MNTFVQNTLPSEIDTSFITTLETYNMIDNLDDLFEAYLGYILHMNQVWQAEILLFNSTQILTPVAESKWIGPPNKLEPKVYSESWLLDYPVRHTAKSVGRTQIRPVFSVPLMDSGTIMGFLNIQLEKLNLVDKYQLSQFHFIGLQLSSNIKEMRLKNEIREIREELQLQISNNRAILYQATSLSKELYAISAISTRINQSMDFDQTLHRCLTTIRKVFKAYSILIYTQNDTNSKIELVACECEDESAIEALNGQYMKSIGKNYLKEVLKSDKPLVKERLAALLPAPEGIATTPPITSLIGVALHSRESTIGAIILLYRSPEPINHSGLRLLSGMANIMGMNIENKALYRQSIQKKSEVDFLFRSIVKFNKTLDLQATLTSVAEKGVEYCGVNSRVYLFSQIKAQVIISSYQRQNDSYVISSSLREKNEFGTLRHIYL
jgi:transcriptional regulator with GAF, ATPase, and Fis domain